MKHTNNNFVSAMSVLAFGISVFAFEHAAFAQAGSWETKAPLLQNRTSLQAEAVGGVVYAIGGAPGGCPAQSPSTEAFDPLANQWSPRAPVPGAHARSEFASAVVDGKIYVFGGGDCLTFSDEVLVYDPVQDSWSHRRRMPTVRSYSPAAAAVDGKIYLIGGSTNPADGGAVAPMLEYDPVGDTWMAKRAMPTARIRARAAAIGGKIYVIGGQTGAGQPLATLEAYDPSTDSWTTLSPMSTRRVQPAAGASDGLLYVFGGTDFQTVFDSGEVYDPALDRWSGAPPLPSPRAATGTAVLGREIYVVGGGSTLAFTPANPANNAPQANAGPDVTVSPGVNCQASVTLNGSASTDPDGDSLTYSWTGSFGSATGATPTVVLGAGTHVITLTIDDAKGGTATDSVTVVVTDTTPPVLTNIPAPIVVEQSSPAGASVVVPMPSAIDNCGSFVLTSDAPPIFPAGTTTVTFTAQDLHNNIATATTTVTVLVPSQMTLNLTEAITDTFQQGVSLLQNALSKLDAGNTSTACNQIAAFINQVKAQSGKKITVQQAAEWIAAAQRIQSALGCGS